VSGVARAVDSRPAAFANDPVKASRTHLAIVPTLVSGADHDHRVEGAPRTEETMEFLPTQIRQSR
jgi:hypothetical protein